MPKIFVSFESDSADELRGLMAALSGASIKPFHAPTPEMAKDAETLSDPEWDAKYGQNAPSEFPPEPVASPGAKPNGGGGDTPSSPPPSAPTARKPGRPPKTPAAAPPAPTPAPAPPPNEPPAMPAFAALRDAIVDAFKRQEPKGIREAAEAMRKKAGYDRIMAMPDTPELQGVLFEFCQTQGIEVV